MPTVLRLDGLRVVVYPNDHRPAHVHVIGTDGEAVFTLNCPEGPPSLRECYQFDKQTISRIVDNPALHLASLCLSWSDIHDCH